jgi:excisionase family DNA binding protein
MGGSRVSVAVEELPYMLRVGEVARILMISESKVYAMIASGELPSITFGRSRRVKRDTLFSWLAEREKTADALARWT